MIWGAIACYILAAICNAVMDTLAHHFKESIFKNPLKPQFFWDPNISSLNKYKHRDPEEGPKFFGATTFLVWTTDAWHLFQFFQGTLIAIAVVLAMSADLVPNLWQGILIVIGMKITWGSVFEFFYSKIFV